MSKAEIADHRETDVRSTPATDSLVGVEPVTRRRVIVLVATMLVAYAFSLILVGLAAGFDHGATRWLVAAGVSALAVGMGASALLRAAVLVVDPQGRTIWWTSASPLSRVFKAAFLLLRFGCALYARTLAARVLSTGFG